jgi:hypothetical protein
VRADLGDPVAMGREVALGHVVTLGDDEAKVQLGEGLAMEDKGLDLVAISDNMGSGDATLGFKGRAAGGDFGPASSAWAAIRALATDLVAGIASAEPVPRLERRAIAAVKNAGRPIPMDTDTMAQIIRDIQLGREPSASYTEEMLRFRDSMEHEFAEFKRMHPQAELWIPTGLEGLPGGKIDVATDDVQAPSSNPKKQ